MNLHNAEWADVWWHSADGLKLYARDYNAADGGSLPVVCLPGLTRNSREFHVLACHLSNQSRVVAVDYRGRGRSARSPDWQTYQPAVELNDILALLEHLSIAKAVFVGTSRGGIITMLMAAAHRERLAGAILNDIGPVIEQKGLARIAGYVGQRSNLSTWDEAVRALKSINPGFDLSDQAWLDFAHVIFRDDDQGTPMIDYDANLAKTLPAPDAVLSTPLPDLWPAFECLKGLPVAVIRGQHSDLLSATTLADMAMRIPGLEAVTIAGRGHTPFLDEMDALSAIRRTIARANT